VLNERSTGPIAPPPIVEHLGITRHDQINEKFPISCLSPENNEQEQGVASVLRFAPPSLLFDQESHI